MEASTGALWAYLALGDDRRGVRAVVLQARREEVANEADRRIDELEDKHTALDRSVAVLTAEVSHPGWRSIDALAIVIKAMDDRRVSGRQLPRLTNRCSSTIVAAKRSATMRFAIRSWRPARKYRKSTICFGS